MRGERADLGYLVVGNSEAGLYKRLWKYIENRGRFQPHVIVVRRSRYAMVRIDMLSAWRKLTPVEQAEAIRLFGLYSHARAEIVVGPDLAQSDRVPIGVAAELAGRLVELGRRNADKGHTRPVLS